MHRSSTIVPPAPNYDDEAFALTERIPRIVIECSKLDPVPRIYEVTEDMFIETTCEPTACR
jgi:hypothetical protein